ncbi:MAG: FAD-binding protein [Acidimicrobiia bacterium]
MSQESLGKAPTHTPTTNEELAALLRRASERGQQVTVVGGGTRQGYGTPVEPDLIVDMGGFADVISWDPDDLTITVGAGHEVGELEEMLAEMAQTAVLPEVPGRSTVGGVIASGVSALRRGRLLGTRERMLEVTLVTGDGRVVRGGGRVVKNVSGYDLPRLAVGSFGALGVITSVCLKLWPVPKAARTVAIEHIDQASAVARPLAVLEDNDRKQVFLWGTPEEVEASAARLGGEGRDGLRWPSDPDGAYRWSLRVPPALTEHALEKMPSAWSFLAVHNAGDIRAASMDISGAEELRQWSESTGGALVLIGSPPEASFEPWGSDPPGLDLQRRLIAQFDPARVINAGRLPGGL